MSTRKQAKPKAGFSRLLEIAGEQRALLILSSVLSVLSSLLMFLPFVSVYFIIAELLEKAATPSLIDYALIRQWGIWALLFMLGALVFTYGSGMSSHVAAFRILYNLRIRLSDHLARLPLGYHNRQSTGVIKKILETSVEKIESFIAHQLPDMVGAIVLPLVMLVTMFIMDWRLALACAVPIIGAFFLQMLLFYGEEGKAAMREYHDSLERMNASGVEYIRGMPAVKVFGLTVHTFKRFNHSIVEFRDWAVKFTKICKRSYVVFLVILSSSLAFILPVSILLLSGQPDNQALALTITVFLVIAPGLSLPVMKLMYLGGTMRMISEGVKRMDGIFAQQPVPEPVNPQLPEGHDIAFVSVSFSYDNQDAATRTEALSEVSFIAKEGEITALVGPSGSGKSTIASLIPRFWDVATGAIEIGGVDVREMSTEKLMDTVSFVFQDVHLFYDTISENIRMGRQEATTEQVISVAKAACCHEFVQRLPQGYQTKIGEGGTYLSGGEAQRVAIARAILKDAPVLVLDEATAFADPENEVNIQQGLISLIRDKTVIVIAHRLTTIKEADKIVVVDGGRLVESGTHDELLATDGLYRRMWKAHVDAGAWELAADEKREGVQLT